MKRVGIFFLLLLVHARVWACTCDDLVVLSKAEVEKYAMIFVGTVTSVKQFEKEGVAHFKIEALHKGKSFPETDLYFDNATDCQMSFAVGEKWIIYADYRGYGQPEVKFCSRSRKQQNKQQDTDVSGMSFLDEKNWLFVNVGVIPFNEKKKSPQDQRKLILPKGMQRLWLYLGGIAGILVIGFLVKRFLR
ncbi:MAG: hypothetical protein ACRCYO_18695 [Bacteroidia bacterium]